MTDNEGKQQVEENSSVSNLSEMEKLVFEKLTSNDTNAFQQLVTQLKGGVNFIDDNGMSPLQHACCKGNKNAVEVLLNMGADIHFNRHGANYTPLHFAAISGNNDICRLLLDAGINPNALNSVSRTASQMAAFVGNRSCVETIINYIPKKDLKCYIIGSDEYDSNNTTFRKGLPPTVLNLFHRFVTEVNLHPVRIVLNLQHFPLLPYINELHDILIAMCNKEMHKEDDCNELLAFKFHYLSWIIGDVLRCREHANKAYNKNKVIKINNNIDNDNVNEINKLKQMYFQSHDEMCSIVSQIGMDKDNAGDNMTENQGDKHSQDKNVGHFSLQHEDFLSTSDNKNDDLEAKTNEETSDLKDENMRSKSTITTTNTNDGGNKHDYLEIYIKRILKENKNGQLDYLDYMIRECVREFPFRESLIFKQVISHLANSSNNAYTILRTAINGHRGFSNIIYCNACANEKPDKKCSKCKAVQYCNRECQRLHWFVHKKSCKRPVSSMTSAGPTLSSVYTNNEHVNVINTDEIVKGLSSLTMRDNKQQIQDTY